METRTKHIHTNEQLWDLLETVMDPEIPVLSVVDLGIVRKIEVNAGPRYVVRVTITPTYSGCPAMDAISTAIKNKLEEEGIEEIFVDTVLSPAWTTDWMTPQGKERLKAFGIAPPNPVQPVCSIDMFMPDEAVQCPHCDSFNTQLISRFGSTACKSLYKCRECLEPFDYFKCH